MADNEKLEMYVLDTDGMTLLGVWWSPNCDGWYWDVYAPGDFGWENFDGGILTVELSDDGNTIVNGLKTVEEAAEETGYSNGFEVSEKFFASFYENAYTVTKLRKGLDFFSRDIKRISDAMADESGY